MIIPALDIINGNTVRLYQGKYYMQSNYGNPQLHLEKYIHQGAKMIHLVDLDGAKNPKNKQTLLITQLIKKTIPFAHIQVGGGIRTAKDIEILLKVGATRVILGSIAVTQAKTVKNWFKYFNPNTLVLAIDVRIHSMEDKKVVIQGWQMETNMSLEQIINEYSSLGLQHVLCTDISKDGTLLGSNINLYKSICHNWPKISFQASGGIHKLIEISKLRRSGINSIIIGKAFLENKFTVSEAISCWQKE